jgi:hypothetical protein
MDPLITRYRFTLKDGSSREFVLELDRQTLLPVARPRGPAPVWTRLEYEQCPHCPLSPDAHPECPAAASIADLLEAFNHLMSFDRTRVEVVMERRTVIAEDVSVQQALGSMMGLFLAVSGCPYTGIFRPMARFHLPLATREETVYRATSMYLLAQYLRRKEGKATDPDMEGLSNLYENVRIVNRHLHRRMSSASETDSSLNAVASLDTFTTFLPMAVEESLAELRPLFADFLRDE